MKIITTVGASLIGNHPGIDCGNLGNQNFSESLFDGKKDSNLKKQIDQKEEDLLKAITDSSACAELASLAKIDPEGTAEVHLLCTETVLSFMCGRVLQRYLDEKGRTVSVAYVEGLKVDDKTCFETKGIPNLMAKIQEIAGENGSFDCSLNISGGYKALIPVLSIMGQLYKMPLFYIYEESDELISITQQGLGVDWAIIEQYACFLKRPETANGGNLAALQRMGLIGQNDNQLTIMGKILSEFLEKNEQPFGKTTIGYMVEYKVWEYLTNNRPAGVSKIIHALKSDNPLPGNEMDDIDVWMQTSSLNGIAVEFKPASIDAKKLKNGLKRHESIATDRGLSIDKYWIVLYAFENRDDLALSNLHNALNTGELNYPVEIKYVQLNRNMVDGQTNRFNQHNFWRSEISEIFHYCHPN